jgi:hypothetical protein
MQLRGLCAREASMPDDWKNLASRSAPVVLFLMSGERAERLLREDAPGLVSWLGGMEYDPERIPPLDIESERLQFHDETGRWPEEWLFEWRRGALADTMDNNFLSHRALLLEPGQ